MIKVGINGLGRMGRLILRAAAHWDALDFVQLNDPAAGNETFAHLLNFDSVHGRWNQVAETTDGGILVDSHFMAFSQNKAIADTDWSACDVVIDATGKHKTVAQLQAYLQQGVKRVVVTAPVMEDRVLNVVVGVNDHQYNPDQHKIITAASCTTNCLAPIVQVLHESIGIKHGSMTTIHDITNTQSILDTPHKDLRRARASGLSLIPTTTGSARAIGTIFPELQGRLNGHAVRVPLANASLTDCAFEMKRATTVDEVNGLFKQWAQDRLRGVLAYEERPLVSVDFKTDPHSCIIDALSTLVINNTQVKVYAWYDNEWGYVNRTAELVRKIGLLDIG